MHQLRAPQPAAAGRTSRRWLGAIATAAVIAGPMLSGGFAAVAANPSAVTVGVLRIDNRDDQPLGVDDTTPVLSWQLAGSGPAARQTAYEVRVADAAGPSLWDTGKVTGPSRRWSYAGRRSRSRARGVVAGPRLGRRRRRLGVERRVEVRDGPSRQRPTGATRRGSSPRSRRQPGRDDRPRRAGRPLRPPRRHQARPAAPRALLRPRLAHPARGDGGPRARRHQPRARPERLGLRPVPAPGCGTRQLTDGKIISPGYISRQSTTQELSPSKWVQVDLGSVQRFDRVVLYPRTDARTPDGQIPNFPVDFTLRTSSTSSTRGEHDQDGHRPAEPAGPGHAATRCRSSPSPSSATSRSADARLYVAGLGAYEATVNGKKVTDTVLNPGRDQPAAVRRVRHLRRHRPRRGRRQHAGRRARQRADQREPAGQRRRRAAPTSTRSSTQLPVPERHADRGRRRGRHDGPRSSSVTGYAVGDTVNVDTGDGGSRLESRKVTAVGTQLADRRAAPSTRHTPAAPRCSAPARGRADGGHAAPARAPRGHLRRRHHGHDRQRPVVQALQARPDDHRQLVRGHRLRRTARAARLGRAGCRPLRRPGLGGLASPPRRRSTPSSCGARPPPVRVQKIRSTRSRSSRSAPARGPSTSARTSPACPQLNLPAGRPRRHGHQDRPRARAGAATAR